MNSVSFKKGNRKKENDKSAQNLLDNRNLNFVLIGFRYQVPCLLVLALLFLSSEIKECAKLKIGKLINIARTFVIFSKNIIDFLLLFRSQSVSWESMAANFNLWKGFSKLIYVQISLNCCTKL